MKKLIRYLFKSIKILLLLLLLAGSGCLGWIASDARDMGFLRPIVRQYLQAKIGAENISLANPTIYLNLSSGIVEFELRHLQADFVNSTAKIKVARAGISAISLLKLKPSYDNLQIMDFDLKFAGNEHNLNIPQLNLQPNADNADKNHLELNLNSQGKKAGKIIADIIFNEKTIVMNAKMQQIPASLLKVALSEVGEIDALMDNQVEAVFTRDFKLIFLQTEIEIAKMQTTHEIFYPDIEKPLQLQNIQAKMNWQSKDNFVQLENLSFANDGLKMVANGRLLPDFSKATFNANITDMNIAQLLELWPRAIADEPRNWVHEHILGGHVSNAEIRIEHNLATSANVELQIEDAKIKYANHLPMAKQARGLVSITEDSLKIRIDEAQSLDSIIVKDGTAEIPSFSDAAVPMNFRLPITARARDVALFLSAKHLNKAPELELRPEKISGEVDGVLTLDFPLYPERAGLGDSSFDNLLFSIESKIKGFKQNNLLGKWNVENFSGTVIMNNDVIALKSSGIMQNSPIKLEVMHQFTKKITDYEFELKTSDDKLRNFDINLPVGLLSGEVDIVGKMKQNKNIILTNATVDLNDSKIDLQQFGWKKPKGDAAQLILQKTSDGKVNRLEMMNLLSGESEIKGAMNLDVDGNIIDANLPIVRLPHTNLALKYVAPNSQNGMRSSLDLRGEKLDISWMQPIEITGEKVLGRKSPDKENPLKYLMDKIYSVKIDELITRKKTLQNFSLKTDCLQHYCKSAVVSAKYGERGKHKLFINLGYGADGMRHFIMLADDIGSIIKAISDNQNVASGRFSLRGKFYDKITGKPLKARMTLERVKLVKAPILTQLLTLASLSGIADTLMGNGILFDKISANVNYTDDRIIFQKGSAKGDALGIMFEGMMQPFGAQNLDITGTVIPSYALNSLPSQVPLLGELLAGGEGEGLFATRFSVRGTMSYPDILVNPLSMITPGFLRNVFEIFPDFNPSNSNLRSKYKK